MKNTTEKKRMLQARLAYSKLKIRNDEFYKSVMIPLSFILIILVIPIDFVVVLQDVSLMEEKK